MTARRDLRVLEDEGQAHRTYGGARPPGRRGVEDSFEQRDGEAIAEKERLARAAAELIADGDTVFADCSTSPTSRLREVIALGREITVRDERPSGHAARRGRAAREARSPSAAASARWCARSSAPETVRAARACCSATRR